MRCKEHPDDDSSSVGVCASCLRERLYAVLVVAQMHSVRENEIRNSEAQRMPLLFPRSASPGHLKSDDDHPSRSRHLRLRATPQVGPAITSCAETYYGNNLASSTSQTKKTGTASLFSRILRFKSSRLAPDMREASSSSSSPASWLAMVFPGSIKNKSGEVRRSMKCSAGRKSSRRALDGLSPPRDVDSDRECNCDVLSPLEIGYASTEWTTKGRRSRSVALAPASTSRRAKAGQTKSLTSMAICLSPLVRASPNCHRNKVGFPADAAISSEFRVREKPNFYAASSSFASRSRKLADFGKVGRNR